MKKRYEIMTKEGDTCYKKQLFSAIQKAGFMDRASSELSFMKSKLWQINYPNAGGFTCNLVDFLEHECTVLSATKALAMLAAGEIDGQKQVWEVAEEGYRLVTDEERVKYKKPTGVPVRYCDGKKWWPADGGYWTQSAAYAVPSDYIFETDQDMKLNALHAKLDEMDEKHIAATFEIRCLISAIKEKGSE